MEEVHHEAEEEIVVDEVVEVAPNQVSEVVPRSSLYVAPSRAICAARPHLSALPARQILTDSPTGTTQTSRRLRRPRRQRRPPRNQEPHSRRIRLRRKENQRRLPPNTRHRRRNSRSHKDRIQSLEPLPIEARSRYPRWSRRHLHQTWRERAVPRSSKRNIRLARRGYRGPNWTSLCRRVLAPLWKRFDYYGDAQNERHSDH